MDYLKSLLLAFIGHFKRVNPKHLLPDFFAFTLSLYLSLFIRLGPQEFSEYLYLIHRHLFLFLAIRFSVFVGFGVYDIMWRYISFKDSLKILKAIILSSIIVVAAAYLVDLGRLPRAVFFIDGGLVIIFVFGLRFGRRWLYEMSFQKNSKNGRAVLIYGAGANGRTLANRMLTDSQFGYRLVGFIDDNLQKAGRIIGGIKVLGTRHELSHIIERFKIKELIVAISNLSGNILKEITEICRTFNIRPRIMAADSFALNGQVELIRDIDIDDLLNRPKRKIPINKLKEFIHGKRVLVTGAGGSIGSELSRQIYKLEPSLLMLLDHSEYNLYQIDTELRLSNSQILPFLVDIKEYRSLESIFNEYLPEIVFHAAAYKHVHLVESNPFTAILNNVEGTKNLLALSEKVNVSSFVLISTDKAVNPVGIMGATKRLCELMVSEVGERTGRRFSSVRFGNVLGSSGSLIPILMKQIEKNEPLTITHKDMTRYFMLIPEAVLLVLRSSTLAQPGDISILKMGEPIKILDIAKALLTLMGKNSNDYPIIFTGLRPGEKISEELYINGTELNTEDPDILVLPRGECLAQVGFDTDWLWEEVNNIIDFAHESDKRAIYQMKKIIQFGPQIPDSIYQSEKMEPPNIWH